MANEMQKMREAVVAISDAIKELRERNPKVVDCVRETICDIEKWANEALGITRKNIEVGTIEEQAHRFHIFCASHQSGIRGICDSSCPFVRCPTKVQCLFGWAQMPYEEERKGEGDGR